MEIDLTDPDDDLSQLSREELIARCRRAEQELGQLTRILAGLAAEYGTQPHTGIIGVASAG